MTKTTHATDTERSGELPPASGEREAPARLNSHFKTSEVVDLLDLSRRQLQYWAKTGLVEPSARTPGGHHRYDFNDLVALKATRRLIDAGVSVQKIRKSVGALRELLPQVPAALGAGSRRDGRCGARLPRRHRVRGDHRPGMGVPGRRLRAGGVGVLFSAADPRAHAPGRCRRLAPRCTWGAEPAARAARARPAGRAFGAGR